MLLPVVYANNRWLLGCLPFNDIFVLIEVDLSNKINNMAYYTVGFIAIWPFI